MASKPSRLIGLKVIKKHPELIPLVTVLGSAITMGCGFIGYALYTKPDVRVIRSRGPAHEDVEPTDLRKLYSVNQKPRPITEVQQLRKDIGSYKC